MGTAPSKPEPKNPALNPLKNLPQDEVPYPGPATEYCFFNTEVLVTIQRDLPWGNSVKISSNTREYHPDLVHQMTEGFRLLSFYNIPQQQKKMDSTKILKPFQGIFYRYPSAPFEYELKVEKSIINTQMNWSGIITPNNDPDCQHLFRAIATNTVNGGRLVCLEMTGQDETQGQRSSTVGCDLFFELPAGLSTENFTYSIVSAPMSVEIETSFFKRKQTPVKVSCDWHGILAQNLSQGFKLVEIFIDKARFQAGFTANTEVNTQWFFEKPASRLNDPTPLYQGVVVEHWIILHRHPRTLQVVKTVTNWEPVIQEMGDRGWELACILETPEEKLSGWKEPYYWVDPVRIKKTIQMKKIPGTLMKCLLFFQRPILSQPEVDAPSVEVKVEEVPPSPAY